MLMKAVFFDLDGTLCDTLSDLAASVNFAMRVFGFPTHSESAVCAMVGNGIGKLIERAVPEEHRAVCNAVHACFSMHYAEHCTDATRPYDGVEAAVATLKHEGYRLAVITNKAHENSVKIVEAMFPRGTFEVVLGQTERYPLKPAPAGLFAVAKALSVQPEEIVYIGDSEVDIRLAENAGTKMIGCTWGFRTKELLLRSGAPVVADHPSEWIDYLAKWRKNA